MFDILPAGTDADIGHHRQTEIEIVHQVDEPAIFRLQPAGALRRLVARNGTNLVGHQIGLQFQPQTIAETPAEPDRTRRAGVEVPIMAVRRAERQAWLGVQRRIEPGARAQADIRAGNGMNLGGGCNGRLGAGGPKGHRSDEGRRRHTSGTPPKTAPTKADLHLHRNTFPIPRTLLPVTQGRRNDRCSRVQN
jgi:hypothetical protein